MVKTGRIISSVYGKIRQILLVYESETIEKGIFIPFMLKLIAKLDPSVQFFFWADDRRAANELQKLLWENGKHSKVYSRDNDFKGITIDDMKYKIIADPVSYPVDHDSFWTQDAFLVLQEEEDLDIHLIKLPDGYGRKNQNLASDLRKTGICEVVKEKALKFCFAGGNILVGSDFALVGEDDFRKTFRITNFRNGPISKEEVKEEVRNLLGIEKIIIVGLGEQLKLKLPQLKHYDKHTCEVAFSSGMNSAQPLKHLDLFMTLAGKVKGQETIVVAKVHPLDKDNEELRKCVKILNETLRITVDKLEQEGFNIVRSRVPAYIEEDRGRTRCLFGFYNNCLVEQFDGRKRVYVPEYGDLNSKFLAFDKRNVIIWEQLGFEVIQVGNLMPFSRKNGALRCLTKCLQRQTQFLYI